MVADYNQRRRMFVSGLNSLGLECYEPQGAFYAFPSIRRFGLNSEEFASRLLEEERVAVVPGSAFGPSGEGHVRCCYASAVPKLEEALKRMESFLKRLECENRAKGKKAATEHLSHTAGLNDQGAAE